MGRLGLGPHIDERYERVSLGAALGHGARQTAFVSTTIVRLLRGMASGRVSTRAMLWVNRISGAALVVFGVLAVIGALTSQGR